MKTIESIELEINDINNSEEFIAVKERFNYFMQKINLLEEEQNNYKI
jgi:hypothetical protein